MYINGAAKAVDKDGNEYNMEILVADIFENNNSFKANIAAIIGEDGFKNIEKCKEFVFNNFEFGQNNIITIEGYFDLIMGAEDFVNFTFLSDTDHATKIENNKKMVSTSPYDPYTINII